MGLPVQTVGTKKYCKFKWGHYVIDDIDGWKFEWQAFPPLEYPSLEVLHMSRWQKKNLLHSIVLFGSKGFSFDSPVNRKNYLFSTSFGPLLSSTRSH